jgi:hypothetical protein
LSGEAAERRFVLHALDRAHLRPGEIECTLGVIVGQRGECRLGDVSRDASLAQRLGDGAATFPPLFDGRHRQLLGERRVIEIPEVDEVVDDLIGEDVIGALCATHHPAGFEERQRPRSQLAQEHRFGVLPNLFRRSDIVAASSAVCVIAVRGIRLCGSSTLPGHIVRTAEISERP